MARKPKDKTGEGAEVRRAMTGGPDIEHDHLIGKIDGWNREDRERASSAAETRGDIGQFTEQTGMNPKALSMLRTIKKAAARDGGQAKAMDIIRSLKKGLVMVEADISGQGTGDMLDDDGGLSGAVTHTETLAGDDTSSVVQFPGSGGALADGGDDYLAEIADEADDFTAAMGEEA